MNDYAILLKQTKALLSAESDAIANAANLAALIFHNVSDLNWAGFYFFKNDELVLGPFQGQIACSRIGIGKGVCGTAYIEKSTQVVADVHQFEGHIACDAASASEIVVPFFSPTFSGVLDIDSPIKSRFDKPEQEFFESLAVCYTESLGRS